MSGRILITTPAGEDDSLPARNLSQLVDAGMAIAAEQRVDQIGHAVMIHGDGCGFDQLVDSELMGDGGARMRSPGLVMVRLP